MVTHIPCRAGVGKLTLPRVHDGGPAEVLVRGTLFLLAIPRDLTQHAPQAPGGWAEKERTEVVIAPCHNPPFAHSCLNTRTKSPGSVHPGLCSTLCQSLGSNAGLGPSSCTSSLSFSSMFYPCPQVLRYSSALAPFP